MNIFLKKRVKCMGNSLLQCIFFILIRAFEHSNFIDHNINAMQQWWRAES